jgi:DNA-binding NarL/FixJ family response regulator
VRIVIGEDSALVREGMAKLLAGAGHDIVAKAGDAEAVVAAVERSDPDLLITDIRMPPTMTDDGARAARTLRAQRPTLPIVLLSQHVETTHSLELVTTGSFGYLLKDRVLDVEDFLDALTRVAAGGSALDPEVVASLVAPTRATDPLASLTERELEVLSLLAQGRSNAAIARQLWTTRRTIETHVRHVFAKLGLLDSDSDSRRVLAVLVYLRNRGGR